LRSKRRGRKERGKKGRGGIRGERRS